MRKQSSACHYAPRRVNRTVLCVAIAQAIFGLSSVQGAVIDVNSASDVSEPSSCNLRDALASANTDQAVAGCVAGSGADTITFDGLSTPATINLTNGQLAIRTPMDIQGPGQDQLTIDAGGLSRVMKIDEDVWEVFFDVSIDGITVTGGFIPNDFNEGPNGAGIANRENLTLSNVTVTGNTTPNANGGLYLHRGIVTITDSTITSNSSKNGGAGIQLGKATLNMTDSFVTNNQTLDGGSAGINVEGGTLNMRRSTVSGNTTQGSFARGGAIYARGLPYGSTSRRAVISIVDSQISQNTAQRGGALAVSSYSTVLISNSTLAANTANGSGSSGGGGAIYASSYAKTGIERYTLTLINTTLSGNSASRNGVIDGAGGFLDINHVTMTGNSASEGPFGAIGGLVLGTGSTVSMSNSIIANSTGADCEERFSKLVSNNNNLIEDGTCPTNAVAQVTADPLLGPLQNNGGLTPTHDLLSASPALKAGDSGSCALQDQRGVQRGDGTCDIGAIELAVVVNTLEDLVASDGLCSFREALGAANLDSPQGGCGGGDQVDTILFSESILPGTITMTGGLVAVTGSTDILGPGAERLTISGNGSSSVLIFNDSNAEQMKDVTLKGLTFSGGGSGNVSGGVIINRESMAISSSVFTGNNALSGGAIFNEGSMTISDSVLSGNTATRSGGGFTNSRGSLSITNSVISNNSASTGGGGFGLAGTLEIVSSSVFGNEGGGLQQTQGTVTLTNSQVFANTSGYGGGLDVFDNGHLIVQNSTISGNTANPGSGGGINMASSTLTLSNSTVSGNDGKRRGGGISFTFGGLVNLYSSTISDNTAGSEGGGGLFQKYGNGTVNMSNSIIANSLAANECIVADGQFNTHMNNLIEDGSCSDGASNLLTGNPMLGTLQDNGGPTKTHAVLAGSPVIDMGNIGACSGLLTDQRGSQRSSDGNEDGTPVCDIGAYELFSSVLFKNGFE